MADYFSDLPPLTTADQAKPGTEEYAIVEWCEARLKQGQRFVESAVGYDKIERANDAVFSNERETGASYIPTPKSLSRTRVNMIGKIAEDLVALLTDTRVFWQYATRNPKYEKQAQLSNDQAEDWYVSRLIDLRIADAVRYVTTSGSSYIHLYYSRQINDMMVEAEDPRHVFPIGPISYHTIQDAKGVILRRARTPDWVKDEYKKTVEPDLGGTSIFGWFTRAISGFSKGKVSGPLSKRAGGNDDAIPATDTVFVNTMYLKDDRTNKKSETVYMGPWSKDSKPETQWSYEVPPGAPLYPFGRMIVWCTRTLLYDGPSPYWHAKFPLIKLTLNPWPKAWLGKAPLWDVMPLNESLNALCRIVDDHAAQLAQPGAVADRNVSRAEMDKFNTRTPGYKVRTNMSSGKGITIVNPPPLDQSLWQHIDRLIDWMQKLSGTADVSQMAQLAQIPSDDTIDTIMKAMTPGVRLRSRVLEGFMKEFAEMYLYCIAEFDTLPKRLAKFGPTAVTPEDYDYAAGSFIPDDVPDGEPGDIAATLDAMGTDSPRPTYVRAKEMLKSFSFNFKPGSLLNSAAQQDRMEDLILSKMGYLSFFTLMEHLGRMNILPASIDLPDDEVSRLALQQKLGIGMVANAQGRKATDAAPPSLQTNSSGDPTLATS